MAEQEHHIRTFVRLANLSQTKQLHEWNLESLARALQWARAAEKAMRGSDDQEIEMNVRRWFPVATLPTLPVDVALTAETLQQARVHLLQSILQSPFLNSHPTRSQLLMEVLRELRRCHPDELEANASISALMTERMVNAPRTNAMLEIARQMSGACRPIRVKVLSGWVDVLPLKSYTLSPRTLHLKAMAKTLQRNAVDARAAADPDTYRLFLSYLRNMFIDTEGGDVREVVVLMLTMCEWPTEEPRQLRGMMEDLVTIVVDWIEHKPLRCWTFKPWLAAALVVKHDHLRDAYISELVGTGLLPPWEREFAERVGTIILRSNSMENALETTLLKLDPYLQNKYFHITGSAGATTS